MGDTTATRQGHQFSRIHGRRHVRYFIYVFSKILHGTAVDKTDFPLNIRIFVFIPIRKFFEFPYQNFSQLVLRHGEYPRAMPASLLQCHRLQCAARALLRRALRSGHVAALGPFRGARAISRRSGHAAALGPCCCARARVFGCCVVVSLCLASCLRRSFCHGPHRNSSSPWGMVRAVHTRTKFSLRYIRT